VNFIMAQSHDNPYDGTGTEYDGRSPWEGMSAGRYIATRIPSLKPPMLSVENPIKLLRMLDRMQWAFFAVAFFAWVGLPHRFELLVCLRVC
jgi:hypothetical protein